MIQDKKHPDGVWHTDELHHYKGWRIELKSRKGHGMKAHVFILDGEKRITYFTLRFAFIKPIDLLTKAIKKIDRYERLLQAWQFCDDEDKSTEFMLEYMQNTDKNENLDSVLAFIQKMSDDNRSCWIRMRYAKK